ncbi:unnamed protein product [Moneuplotes crassus]|uniref:UDENN domain-containing protein n=1 Tax=Euplotes crassus TaxID=5936 RepID=A0AAD1X7T9_EUPCR|nr:unnamed protein product [Moneuplotes crassus]
MEQKSKNLFGSLAGDNAELFYTSREEEDSKSHNLGSDMQRSNFKQNRGSHLSNVNDFSILSYISGEERKTISSDKTSSDIHASSMRSCSHPSPQIGFEDTIEIQMNASIDCSEEDCGYHPIVRKLLIIGAKHMSHNQKKPAEVIAFYPDSDSEDGRSSYPILSEVIFPNGISAKPFDNKTDEEKLYSSQFFYMILTNTNSSRTYCSFLLFKELVLIDGGTPVIVPKAICLMGDECMFRTHRQFLNLIFKNVIIKNNMRSLETVADDPMNYILSVAMSVQIDLKENFHCYLKEQLEYYISLMFYHLNLPRNLQNLELKNSDNYSIRYQNILGSEGLFIPENFSYEYLLLKVRPYRILELIVAIMHERPVFIIDDNIAEMAIVMKSLVSLIKPMSWVGPIVPCIIESMSGIIGNPVGSLTGIHSKIWKEKCEENEGLICDYAYILFLNEDSNICKNKLCDIPAEEVLRKFLKIFRDYLETPMDENCKLRTQCDLMLKKIGLKRKPKHEDYMVYTQLKIDFEFFFKVFLRLFSKIPKFFNYDVDPIDYMERKETRPVFDKDKFLESVEPEHYEFVKGCVKTQLFECFIDKAFKMHHNLLEENEKDYEKVGYFFKCCEVWNTSSSQDLRNYMNKHFRAALRNYYNNKNTADIEKFSSMYIEKFESYFQEKLTPTNYLIQQTVINGEKQLSLIEDINLRLVMKHLPRAFEDEDYQADECQEDTTDSKNIQKKYLDKYNFNDFGHLLGIEATPKLRLAQSQSSRNIEVRASEQEGVNLFTKPKKYNADEKRAAFRNKRQGKTQYLPTKILGTDFTEETKPSVGDIDEDIKGEILIETASDNLSLEKENTEIYTREDQLKSFRQPQDLGNISSFRGGNIGPRTSPRISFKNIQTSAKVDNTALRKNRINQEYKKNLIYAPLKKNKSYNQTGNTSYRTSRTGPGCSLLEDSSPCDASQNMRIVNQESCSSKKFLEGIDSNRRKDEKLNVLKEKPHFNSPQLEVNYPRSDQKFNYNDSEMNVEVNSDKKKIPLESKPRLKRGLTVKFEDNERMKSFGTKKKEAPKGQLREKLIPKRNYRVSVPSNNNSIGKSKRNNSSRKKPSVIPLSKAKSTRVSKGRDKSKSYGGDKLAFNNGPRNPKLFEDQNPYSMFEETRKNNPCTSISDKKSKTRNKIRRYTSGSMTSKGTVNCSTFVKASFVAIQAKPDPTREGRIFKKKHQIPKTPITVKTSQVSSQTKLAGPGPPNLTRRKIDSTGLLKKCKSHIGENEFDTVIIEEEYHTGSRKTSPLKIFKPTRIVLGNDTEKNNLKIKKGPRLITERNNIVEIEGEKGFNPASNSRKSKDDGWNYVVEKTNPDRGLTTGKSTNVKTEEEEVFDDGESDLSNECDFLYSKVEENRFTVRSEDFIV